MHPQSTRPVSQAAATPAALPTTFTGEAYTIRRKVFRFFGAAFHLLDASGNVVGYSNQKAFKLKEDIRVYTDESMQSELLTIRARNIIDFSATYDVVDARAGGQPVGSLRRKGLKSTFLRDEWLICAPDGREIGVAQEDSGALGFLRRYIEWLDLIVPQKFNILVGGTPVARLRTHRNPFVYRLSVAFAPNMSQHIDSRLVLATSILIAAIEGRQT